MTRIQLYWQEVRRLEGELPDVVPVVALTPNARPTVALVERVTGARLLADQRVRLATSEEVTAHFAGADRRAEVDAAIQQGKFTGVAILPSPKS